MRSDEQAVGSRPDAQPSTGRELRIAIDAASLLKPKTGISEYTANLIRSLGRLNEPRLVLFHSSPQKRNLNDLMDGLEHARVKVSASRVPSWLLALAWHFLPFPPADWFTGPVDIFHSPNYRAMPVRGPKLVVTVADLVVLKYPEHQVYTRVKHISAWLRKLHRADAVVAISENTRRDILELLDVPPEKVHVVYPAYNMDLFAPEAASREVERVRSHYGLGERYLLYVGTLEPRKNLVRLIQAYDLLRKKGGADDVDLVLTGLQGWGYDDIFEEIRKRGLHDRVKYIGYAPDEDLPGLMSGALALAYPSIYEGFGIPPLEAMAVGTPVLTSNAASLPEVVGDAGIQVDPEDIKAMAAGLERLCGDESLRKQLRGKGLEQAKRFTWDETARKMMALYEGLLDRR